MRFSVKIDGCPVSAVVDNTTRTIKLVDHASGMRVSIRHDDFASLLEAIKRYSGGE